MKNVKAPRAVMNLASLKRAGAQCVARFNRFGDLQSTLVDGNGRIIPTTSDEFARPGFYFFVHLKRQTVYARFFMGRTRSKTGLRNVASQLRLRRSQTGDTIMNASTVFDVYFIAHDEMKMLTTAFGKGRVGQALARSHSGDFQNLSEMNRMLNDNFRFYAQGY